MVQHKDDIEVSVSERRFSRREGREVGRHRLFSARPSGCGGVSGTPRTTDGLLSDHGWPAKGPPTDHLWSAFGAFGLSLDCFWTAFEPPLERLRSAFGSSLDCQEAFFGPPTDRLRTFVDRLQAAFT